MRMLHVFDTVSPKSGGPIEGFRKQQEVLCRHGVEIEVVTLDSDAEEIDPFDVPLHRLGGGSNGGMPALVTGLLGHTFAYAPRLVPWLIENARRFDCVISHGIWTYSVVGTARALRKVQIPHFIFIHGMMDPWFRHRFPLKHLKKQIYWSLALARALRESKMVLFTCEEEKRLATGVFLGGGGYNGRAIAYGTSDAPERKPEHDLALRAATPSLGNSPYLLFLSRIHPKKGCDLLVEAFGRLASTRPELHLVMAGPDEVGWRHELEMIALRLGVIDRVHFPGMLKGDAKYGAFYGAEAFVLPSHQENFGIAVAEAMACRLPVLTTTKVNIWREVRDAGAGLINADTLAGTIEVLRQFYELTPIERSNMGARGRALFLSNYDTRRTALSLLEAVQGHK